MKYVTAIIVLSGAAAAKDWGKTCNNETLDAATDVLTATCNEGDDHITYNVTSLDLNKCLVYKNSTIMPGADGNFGSSCKKCHLYRLYDEWWGHWRAKRPWMNCTCHGAGHEVAINLDLTPIDNKFGTLQCVQ